MSAVLTSDMRPSDAGHHQFEGAAFYMPEDPEWTKALDRVRGDFYYLPGYARLAAAQEGGQPLLFVARHKQDIWLLPLIVRAIPSELAGRRVLYDAVSPYGYSGPLAVVADASDFMRWNEHAAGLLKAALVRRGIVAAFIRLHPLRPAALGALERHGSLGAPRATVVVDLTRPIDQLWRETRRAIVVRSARYNVGIITHIWTKISSIYSASARFTRIRCSGTGLTRNITSTAITMRPYDHPYLDD